MANLFRINDHIQQTLKKKNMKEVTAVEAAEWLDRAGILKDSDTRKGLPLRDLLRGGKIRGQRQEANRRWFIDLVD